MADYRYVEWSDERSSKRAVYGGIGGGSYKRDATILPPSIKQAPSLGGGNAWLLPQFDFGGNNAASGPYGASSRSVATFAPPGPPKMQIPYPMRAGYDSYSAKGSYGYPPMAQHTAEISFDTSSKDQESVRSRVFIGSLVGGQEVGREDIIGLTRPYGVIRGVTFFKKQGYAFVQFENPEGADAACRVLNGMRWMGCQLDVHPVDLNEKFTGVPSKKGGRLPADVYEAISYDTSSRDPVLLRARVFIGSITRGNYTRNDIVDLFLPYGKITAVTLFRGYAFVQFESPVDAVNACEKVNGKPWMGNVKVDVHLAMEGPTRKRNTDEATSSYLASPTAAAAAAASPADTTMDWTHSAPKRAREAAPNRTGCEIICMTCRFSCSTVTDFTAHREQGGCVKVESDGEPPALGCASCEAVMPNAWRLLFHLMDDHHHRMKLVAMESGKAAIEKAKADEEKRHEEWWENVQRWIESHPKKEDEEGEIEEKAKEKTDEGVVVTGATIVCATCKLVTEDWTVYSEHRKNGDCYKGKDPLEPACLVCTMCQESFTSAWKALFHLIDFHRMKLFYPEYSKEGLQRATEQQARERAIVDKRIKTWIEGQGI